MVFTAVLGGSLLAVYLRYDAPFVFVNFCGWMFFLNLCVVGLTVLAPVVRVVVYAAYLR